MSSTPSMTLARASDERGSLEELLKSEKYQVTSITIRPGKVRGGHYHLKLPWETFIMVSGEQVVTEKAVMIPGSCVTYWRGQRHSFANTSREKEAELLIIRRGHFDMNNPDTYYDQEEKKP